jgi:hypothetical protein
LAAPSLTLPSEAAILERMCVIYRGGKEAARCCARKA